MWDKPLAGRVRTRKQTVTEAADGNEQRAGEKVTGKSCSKQEKRTANFTNKARGKKDGTTRGKRENEGERKKISWA